MVQLGNGANGNQDERQVDSYLEQLRLSSVEQEFRRRISEYKDDGNDSGSVI